MSPLVAYHASARSHRPGIQAHGLLCNQPTQARPYGVYVYRDDGGIDHPARARCAWEPDPDYLDIWRVAYIGPARPDMYVLNALILLEHVPPSQVSLVTDNI